MSPTLASLVKLRTVSAVELIAKELTLARCSEIRGSRCDGSPAQLASQAADLPGMTTALPYQSPKNKDDCLHDHLRRISLLEWVVPGIYQQAQMGVR